MKYIFSIILFSIVFDGYTQKEITELKQSRIGYFERVRFLNDLSVKKMNLRTRISLLLPTFNKPLTWFYLGYYFLANGNNENGNKFMTFALSHFEEKNADLFHEISVWNTKNGNYSLAVQYLDSAAKYDKEVYGYYGWVSLYYYRDYQKAIDYLETYDSLTPNFSDYPMGESILNLKGMAYMNLSQYEKAISYFEKHIEFEKTKNGENWIDPISPYYRGICFEKLGNIEKAMESYDLALKIKPEFPEALYHKALLTKEENTKKEMLLKSLEYLNKGSEIQDVYIELFEKVYPQEIEIALSQIANID